MTPRNSCAANSNRSASFLSMRDSMTRTAIDAQSELVMPKLTSPVTPAKEAIPGLMVIEWFASEGGA